MRRLLILTLPALLTMACDSDDGDGGGDRNSGILALSSDATTGETVFTSGSCAIDACHGADGNSGMAPGLTGLVGMRSDDALIDAVLDGVGNMPAQSLGDQEMADLLAYLKANFG